ncbi:hypothetical protein Taro_045327 [Colocasia esculenta]|uniref:BTB domain-containing protein n=1 Tax=Colocasia esculenta TaxID=4460 RepID=A0A843X414_COLES|nr:hypothetical protein [Colocasia esculenta]
MLRLPLREVVDQRVHQRHLNHPPGTGMPELRIQALFCFPHGGLSKKPEGRALNVGHQATLPPEKREKAKTRSRNGDCSRNDTSGDVGRWFSGLWRLEAETLLEHDMVLKMESSSQLANWRISCRFLKHVSCWIGKHMDKAVVSDVLELGDRSTSDVTIRLRNRDGRPEWFFCHSFVLSKKSRFFAERLSDGASTHLSLNSTNCVEIYCSGSEYDYHVKLLKLLYLTEDPPLESWESVKSALGVLQASVTLGCEGITKSCTQYLEAVPWDEKEEEDIIKAAPKLGPAAMPILARIQPVDKNATKDVLISAIRFATTVDESFPPFTDELKTSAQEQVEYMLMEDEETPLLTLDEDVKSELKTGLSKLFSTFDAELASLAEDFNHSPETSEQKVLQSLTDLEWSSVILPKLNLMQEFVSHWTQISCKVLSIVQGEKFDSGIWALKAKLIDVAGKALEAVGYGTVILPAPSRFQLLKTWLPYIRKMKPLLDMQAEEDESFPYKMDGDLCQTIEGAITSLVLALPSNDQVQILTDWMKEEHLRFPDLSEAFEVWSYRAKAAKRRLAVGLDGIGNPPVSL